MSTKTLLLPTKDYAGRKGWEKSPSFNRSDEYLKKGQTEQYSKHGSRAKRKKLRRAHLCRCLANLD